MPKEFQWDQFEEVEEVESSPEGFDWDQFEAEDVGGVQNFEESFLGALLSDNRKENLDKFYSKSGIHGANEQFADVFGFGKHLENTRAAADRSREIAPQETEGGRDFARMVMSAPFATMGGVGAAARGAGSFLQGVSAGGVGGGAYGGFLPAEDIGERLGNIGKHAVYGAGTGALFETLLAAPQLMRNFKTGASKAKNMASKVKENVVKNVEDFKEAGKQIRELEPQAKAGDLATEQLGEYETTRRRALEKSQEPVDAISSRKDTLEKQTLDVDKQKYQAEQEQAKFQETISDTFEDVKRKPAGEKQQQATDALKKARKDYATEGSEKYNSLNKDTADKGITKAEVKQNNLLDLFEHAPKSLKRSIAKSFRTQKITDIHDAYKDLGKYISEMRHTKATSGLSTSERDAMNKAIKIRSNMKKGMTDAYKKAGGEEFVARFEDANKFWGDNVTSFDDITFIRDALSKGKLKTPDILSEIEKQGGHELKKALMENPEFLQSISDYQWSNVNVKNPAKVIEAVEGDLGKTLPKDKRGMIETLANKWKNEGDVAKSLEKTLKENGFSQKDINLKIKELNKEVAKEQAALSEIERAKKDTARKTDKTYKQIEMEKEKRKEAILGIAKKVGIAKLVSLFI